MKKRMKTEEGLIAPEILRYCLLHGAQPSEHIKAIFAETERNALTKKDEDMLSGPLVGFVLQLLVVLLGAKRVLEIGTFTGASALFIAEKLGDDGRVDTIDINADYMAFAKSLWKRSPHGGKIHGHIGALARLIPLFRWQFDLVFIDEDKINYGCDWDIVVPLVRSGGLIVVDDTLHEGRVIAPQTDRDRAMDAFNKKVAADRRVELVMPLPLGDGLTVARKK